MANLHKTERKLPWLERDGGPSPDWLEGRNGGEFFAVELVWHASHRFKTHALKFAFCSLTSHDRIEKIQRPINYQREIKDNKYVCV